MKQDALLDLARTRMAESQDADRENRGRDMDDLQKITGKQWPDKIRNEREADNKPCLTFNRLPQFVRQVTGDIRRMNPAVKIEASDNSATKETAEIYEGLIREIEQRCDAASVYEGTTEQAAASSIGWFRIKNDWVSDDSFEQEINIKRIRDSFSVYCDPAAEEPTREDSNYIFITEHIRKEEFEEQYPGKVAADAEHDSETDGLEHWHHNDKVTIAEYFWKEASPRTLYQFLDGSTAFKDELAEEPPKEAIARKREVDGTKVMWAKISGKDVLEGPREIPCDYIPVFAVTGEEWHVGEETYRSSVIRFAKDAQQLYNYMRSSAAEVVTIQPRSPYVGTVKQFQGLEAHWQNANKKNYSFLPYNPDEKAPGAPQRQAPPMASQGLSAEGMQAAEDMKATTGIYDAALGNRSNEASGVAIRQRQMESDVSTSIYSDNMAKAIKACGQALVSMIPRVYDTARVVKILGEDGAAKSVPINQRLVENGEAVDINNLSAGRYAVRVNVGPNYSTRRQETQEGMVEFLKVVPGAAQITGDLVAEAMDWPNAERFADRLKRMLPPNMRDQDDLSPEEQEMMAHQMQEQAAQAERQRDAEDIEMQKAAAEGQEAQADAQKASLEAEEKRLELLAQSGALGQLVQQEVQRQVVAILTAPRPGAPI
jgi:hypothetical protein